jgi:serine/threonine protein kinase/nucleoside phosphorylase
MPSQPSPQSSAESPCYCAVVITAIACEFEAVRARLTNISEDTYSGTVFEVGQLKDDPRWRIAVTEAGPGNNAAAAQTERAIARYRPQVALFIGVAGGLKDVNLGDVVAATKAYGYERGKDMKTFQTRPDVGSSALNLVQRARAEARAVGRNSEAEYKALVAPIAAGEKVVASTHSATCRFIAREYSDAVAIEMEGRGFLEAVYANNSVSGLVIRGISDLINGKKKADAKGSQERASKNATDFAVRILKKFIPANASLLEADPFRDGVPPSGAPDVHEEIVKAGSILDGKWLIESKIGQGGMAEIFLAHDIALNRQIAIKILSDELCRDKKFIERFEREAKLTAKLDHPNIVPIHAVGHFGARPFIVMKFLQGAPLKIRIRESPTGMLIADILPILKQLCSGLSRIHNQGIVHRDIKSANIYLSGNGHVTILDFGIFQDTREKQVLTRTDALMGTPHYMTPEQAKGKTIDARTDLYALGCIIFEMFTGHLPFNGGTNFEILEAHVHKPPPNLCDERKDVPSSVGKIVQKMLAKKPEDRYQTAEELYGALEKELNQENQENQENQREPVHSGIEGNIYYFGNYEWLVLEVKDNKALLLAKDVLIKNPYNKMGSKVTWESSTLRAWLNNEFLNEFTSQEQARIALTTNVNENNPSYGTKGGNNTIDCIFLLSISEVRHYFDSNSARIAKYNGSTAWWWLRSPGVVSKFAAYVNADGGVYVIGNSARSNSRGVRPALWLNL